MSNFTEINKKRAWKLIKVHGLDNLNNPKKVKEAARQEWPTSFSIPPNSEQYLQEFIAVFKEVWKKEKEGRVNNDNGYKTALILEKNKIEAEVVWLNHRLQYIEKELNKGGE